MERSIPLLFPTARTKSKKQVVDHPVSHLHHLARFSLILALDCTRCVQILKARNLSHTCGFNFIVKKVYYFIPWKCVFSLLSFVIWRSSPFWHKLNWLELTIARVLGIKCKIFSVIHWFFLYCHVGFDQSTGILIQTEKWTVSRLLAYWVFSRMVAFYLLFRCSS